MIFGCIVHTAWLICVLMLGDIAPKKEVKKAGAKLSSPAFGHVIKKLKI